MSLSGYLAFLRRNKLWWLGPIVLVWLWVIALLVLAPRGATTFEYRMF